MSPSAHRVEGLLRVAHLICNAPRNALVSTYRYHINYAKGSADVTSQRNRREMNFRNETRLKASRSPPPIMRPRALGYADVARDHNRN